MWNFIERQFGRPRSGPDAVSVLLYLLDGERHFRHSRSHGYRQDVEQLRSRALGRQLLGRWHHRGKGDRPFRRRRRRQVRCRRQQRNVSLVVEQSELELLTAGKVHDDADRRGDGGEPSVLGGQHRRRPEVFAPAGAIGKVRTAAPDAQVMAVRADFNVIHLAAVHLRGDALRIMREAVHTVQVLPAALLRVLRGPWAEDFEKGHQMPDPPSSPMTALFV